MTNQTIPPSQASSGGSSNNSNCFLKGCLIILALFLVSCCCLGALVALPFVTDFDPLGLDLRHKFNEYFPWEDFLDAPSSIPDLPELFSGESDHYEEDEDSFTDHITPDLDSSGDSAPESGAFPLVPYGGDDFPFAFSYPEGWEISADEYAESVIFYDIGSYTDLSVGRDWIEVGWTAAYTSERLMETLEFQAQEGTFEVIKNTPFIVSTGDDAQLNAYEWIDMEDTYQWAYDINIIADEYNIYFFMVGDDPVYFEIYGTLIEEIGASFSR